MLQGDFTHKVEALNNITSVLLEKSGNKDDFAAPAEEKPV
jgi:hypothetical protein